MQTMSSFETRPPLKVQETLLFAFLKSLRPVQRSFDGAIRPSRCRSDSSITETKEQLAMLDEASLNIATAEALCF